MHKCFRFISIVLLSGLSCGMAAQNLLPDSLGACKSYQAMITMPKGYVSGVCMLVRDSTGIVGSLFNEFGFSALDFRYHEQKDKVEIVHAMALMDKWYIRKVLRNDLRMLLQSLAKGDTLYEDKKYKLTYVFTPMREELKKEATDDLEE
ncbi:MAG: hypothetical protein HXO22_03160 [Prevotella sp.]|nr:hypothetical protein [Prevotella sp.]MBF1584745.1 hypothetical protein [Prevotella sp.]